MLSKGLAYEKIALNYLSDQGLVHVDSNYRSKFGEIDLIMRDRDTLVFVEVRFRSASQYGNAASTITTSKQKKISKTANLFLTQRKLWNHPCRFDVISIDRSAPNRQESINWIPAAFDAS
jgi:putative endonuclease